MTISEIYTNCIDVDVTPDIVIYDDPQDMVKKENGHLYHDIVNVPFNVYANAEVSYFQVVNGNIHVTFGGV